jgi:hypothetical protein
VVRAYDSILLPVARILTNRSAAVLDHLFAQRQLDHRILLFFPTASCPASLQAETILRCLIRQCFPTYTHDQDTEQEITKARDDFWSSGSLKNLSKYAVKGASQVFVVIDGLDELEKTQRRELLQHLKTLLDAQVVSIKLFLTSRPSLKSEFKLNFPTCHNFKLKRTSTKLDLEHFTKDVVLERRRLGDLAITDDGLLNDVISALTNGANGM